MDLFANRQNTCCPLWFSLGGDNPPLGIDALGHQWPDLRLYTFPPIPLLQQVLCRVADEGRELILIAPHWPNQPWAADLFNMSVQQPWELPLRRDLLTQAHRTSGVVASQSLAPERCRLIASGLSDAVVATIQSVLRASDL